MFLWNVYLGCSGVGWPSAFRAFSIGAEQAPGNQSVVCAAIRVITRAAIPIQGRYSWHEGRAEKNMIK